MISDGKLWELVRGDCIEEMSKMPIGSFDFSVFSPPFPSVFAYTSSERDLGNSEDMKGEAKIHLSYFYRQLARVVKPGRVIVVHVTQIPRMKRSGGQGLFDFRGMNIRLAERAGLIFDYDWAVAKNPQSQAIRTKSHQLQFAGLERDRANSRGALPDYLLKFVVPGENRSPVRATGQVTRNDWIKWAECCWSDIRETETLNVKEGRGDDDTKHIAPLQLEVIRRLVRLYSDPDEVVFSPFAGIGSEGYIAVKEGRRFVGCELKPEYYAAAVKNLERAERDAKRSSASLFDEQEEDSVTEDITDESETQ